MARAKRSKEIPQLEKQYVEERVRARDFWEQQEIERVCDFVLIKTCSL